MLCISRFPEGRLHSLGRRQHALMATVSLLLLTTLSGLAQDVAKKPAKPVTKPVPEIKEELILKNGDRLTGQLLNSTGTEIKFKSDLAGEVTVAWDSVTELKSAREFAVITKNVKDARNSAMVPQGTIKIENKAIVVYAISAHQLETSAEPIKPEAEPATSAAKDVTPKEVPVSTIGFVVDDSSYLKEIHRKIHWTSGWDGHITTGSTVLYSTQDSYLFEVSTALKRIVPTVSWLNPKLRTTLDFTLSAGQTTQPDTPTIVTNIYHADAERDEYFSPRGYYLQMLSFDHNYAQGLVLQQNYGGGLGATLFKKPNSEFDITVDLHYEKQQFNATADVSELNLNLIGTSLTEAYTQKWGKVRFDEKILADVALNDPSAFSAAGNASVRMPVYKKLGFSVSVIDNLLNNPQVGYKKNSFQFSTGFSLSLH